MSSISSTPVLDADDASGFAGNVIERPSEPKSEESSAWTEYDVRFGTAFSKYNLGNDQLGFVGNGSIGFSPDTVRLSGRRRWPSVSLLRTLLGIAVVPVGLLINALSGIAFLIAFVVVHYCCVSRDCCEFSRSAVSEVDRQDSHIGFNVSTAPTQTKRSVISALNLTAAERIETALKHSQ